MSNIPNSKFRKILLSEEINNASVKDIINTIMDINADDDENEEVYKDWERKPIELFINSFGGSAYDGLGLVDIIKQSKTPVHTIVVGSAMSMGLWIFLAGEKRFIGENSTLMFHEIASFINDKAEGIKYELSELNRLQKIYNSFIVSNSSVTQKMLDDYIHRKAEWYISADEAIKLKLADDFYKK